MSSATATNAAYWIARVSLPRWRGFRPPVGLAVVVAVISGRRLGAEPLLVDGVVRSVGLGSGDHLVDSLEQRGVSALLNPEAVLFAGVELGADLELAGVLLDVVGPHRQVIHGTLDLVGGQRLLEGGEVLKLGQRSEERRVG